MQFLHLGITREFHMPSAIRSLKGNCAGGYRNVNRILDEVKLVNNHDLHNELERVLTKGCPAKFYGETSREQCLNNLNYVNHVSINSNLEKVDFPFDLNTLVNYNFNFSLGFDTLKQSIEYLARQ